MPTRTAGRGTFKHASLKLTFCTLKPIRRDKETSGGKLPAHSINKSGFAGVAEARAAGAADKRENRPDEPVTDAMEDSTGINKHLRDLTSRGHAPVEGRSGKRTTYRCAHCGIASVTSKLASWVRDDVGCWHAFANCGFTKPVPLGFFHVPSDGKSGLTSLVFGNAFNVGSNRRVNLHDIDWQEGDGAGCHDGVQPQDIYGRLPGSSNDPIPGSGEADQNSGNQDPPTDNVDRHAKRKREGEERDDRDSQLKARAGGLGGAIPRDGADGKANACEYPFIDPFGFDDPNGEPFIEEDDRNLHEAQAR